MSERLMALGIQALVLGGVYLLEYPIFWTIRKVAAGTDVSSFRRHSRSFATKHPIAAVAAAWSIMAVIVPAGEEILCRLWLIAFFPTLTSLAWIGIIASGVLFGLAHYKHAATLMMYGKEELPREMGLARGALRVVATSVVGILCGYVGIKYQSLYAALAVHAGVNSLPVLPLLLMPVIVGIGLISRVGRYLAAIEPRWQKWRFKRATKKMEERVARL